MNTMAFPGTDARPRWRLSSLELYNWGSFQGPHTVPFDEDANLLVGASGTGKSTILDAFLMLFHDNRISLNSASNESGRSTRRTPISYVRGQVGKSGQGEDSIALTLRGQDAQGRPADAWGAISGQFASSAGEILTVVRVFYVPAHAASLTGITVRLGVLRRAFALTELEPFIDSKFADLSTRIPGWELYRTFDALRDAVFREFEIPGDGEQALNLMHKVQSAAPMDTVDALYQSLVLSRPGTFALAEEALAGYRSLADMRAQMVTAREQIEHLDGIEEQHAELVAALGTQSVLGTLGDPDGDTPFALWQARRTAQTLESIDAAARERAARGTARADALAAQERAAKGRLKELEAAYHASGGAQIAQLEAAVVQRRGALEDVRRRAESLARTLAEGSLDMPAAPEEHAALAAEGQAWLADYEEHASAANEAYHQAVLAAGELTAQERSLSEDIARLGRQRSRIRGPRAEARSAYLSACGMDDAEMPFIAELIDLRDGCEEWRRAANAVLGGWASNLVVDQSRRAEVQRAVDGIAHAARVHRYPAQTGLALEDPAPENTLAGKLVVKEDSPFAGWVRRELNERFAYECVAEAADLGDGRVPRVSLSGQTAERSRDSHGGNPRENDVLGFSNEGLLERLRAELADVQARRAQADESVALRQEERDSLGRQRAAWKALLELTWRDIDVPEAVRALEEADEARRAALQDPEAASLAEQIAGAEAAHLQAVEARAQAESEAKKSAAAAKETAESLVVAVRERDRLERRADLTPAQAEALDARLASQGWEPSAESPREAVRSWSQTLARVVADVQSEGSRAGEDAEQRRDALRQRFRSFNARWQPADDRGDDPILEFQAFKSLLDELRHHGLPDILHRWESQAMKDNRRDISTLLGQYDQEVSDAAQKIDEINRVLAAIPFRNEETRLQLDVRVRIRESRRLSAFLDDLRRLEKASAALTASDADEYFEQNDRVFSAIEEGAPDRELLLDVNRHMTFFAFETPRDSLDYAPGKPTFQALSGEMSGGEMQEVIAFIAGAALRDLLGDVDDPRFMTVVLDEAFIKADAHFTERGVNAWRTLGFQLIVGAPEDKTVSFEESIGHLVEVVKDPVTRLSRAYVLRRAGG